MALIPPREFVRNRNSGETEKPGKYWRGRTTISWELTDIGLAKIGKGVHHMETLRFRDMQNRSRRAWKGLIVKSGKLEIERTAHWNGLHNRIPSNIFTFPHQHARLCLYLWNNGSSAEAMINNWRVLTSARMGSSIPATKQRIAMSIEGYWPLVERGPQCLRCRWASCL